MLFRKMETRDIPGCFQIRTSVRENHLSLEQLHRLGITEESVAGMLGTTHAGWVCEIDRGLAGFSMANRANGELWVIAVLPEHEGRGIGRRLMELTTDWLRANGSSEIWLTTSADASTRAYAFYRKLGWSDRETRDGERIMTLRFSAEEGLRMAALRHNHTEHRSRVFLETIFASCALRASGQHTHTRRTRTTKKPD